MEIIFTQKQFPSSLIFDFLTVFHMVWNNQESCESLLVGFWISRHSKMQSISVSNLFFACLSCQYGFTDCFEILIFLFSNIIVEEFYPVKYYFSSISTSRKNNLNFLWTPILEFQSDLANFEDRFLLIRIIC